jgi:phospholipid/cholesterol/gamma-HCH transport system substrate-binding protein
MGEKTKNMLVGLFILLAVFFTFSIVLFLKPSVGDGKQTLYVRFSNINRITVGTRVTFAGKPVGEVVKIEEIHDARDQPSDVLGQVYFYQLVLKIDSHVKVYNTDEITVQTSGLLGEKSVAIIPKTPPKGVVPKLITNQPVYADSVDPIENTLHELGNLSIALEGTVQDIHTWLNENKDQVSYAIKWFGESMSQANIALTSFNEDKLTQNFKQAAQDFSHVMQQASSAMDQLETDDVFKNIGTTMANFTKASRSIDLVTQSLADGTGTLGKLIRGDDFYLQMTDVMSKVETLMNDINHYGLLFNNNKQWQRLRLQRATLLNNLETADQFKNYFNQEIDQINTAMERLTMVVDRAEEKHAVLETRDFREDFAELLRKVDTLADNLRLYNQKLVEQIQH